MNLRLGNNVGALAIGALLSLSWAPALAGKTQNVVLIVSDGLRWQEVFSGADPALPKASAARRQCRFAAMTSISSNAPGATNAAT
jgi:hypothetical protein